MNTTNKYSYIIYSIDSKGEKTFIEKVKLRGEINAYDYVHSKYHSNFQNLEPVFFERSNKFKTK